MDDIIKIIIASHSEREAITACLIKHRLNVELVLVSDLLNQFEIFDCTSDKATHISWFRTNGDVITNENCILINRIMQVPSELFLNFVEQDRFYAQREFEAYLGFSLNAFVGFSNTSPNGLCGQFLSLPQQWELVRGIEGLVVPDYYWGLDQFNSLHGQERLIYSSIYNLFNWTIHDKPIQASDNTNESVFCFLKPYGLPVFVCCIGGQILITHHTTLSDGYLHQIEQIVHDIDERVDYFAYELLLFIQDGEVTFGCINHEILKSVENPLFESFVLSSVERSVRSLLGAVDNSSVEARRPAACPRDPEMLLNMQFYCTEIDRTGSRGQAAGRRDLNCQQPLEITKE